MIENRTLLELKNKFLRKTLKRNIYKNGSAREERGREGSSLDQVCEGVERNCDSGKDNPAAKVNLFYYGMVLS